MRISSTIAAILSLCLAVGSASGCMGGSVALSPLPPGSIETQGGGSANGSGYSGIGLTFPANFYQGKTGYQCSDGSLTQQGYVRAITVGSIDPTLTALLAEDSCSLLPSGGTPLEGQAILLTLYPPLLAYDNALFEYRPHVPKDGDAYVQTFCEGWDSDGALTTLDLTVTAAPESALLGSYRVFGKDSQGAPDRQALGFPVARAPSPMGETEYLASGMVLTVHAGPALPPPGAMPVPASFTGNVDGSQVQLQLNCYLGPQ